MFETDCKVNISQNRKRAVIEMEPILCKWQVVGLSKSLTQVIPMMLEDGENPKPRDCVVRGFIHRETILPRLRSLLSVCEVQGKSPVLVAEINQLIQEVEAL